MSISFINKHFTFVEIALPLYSDNISETDTYCKQTKENISYEFAKLKIFSFLIKKKVCWD